MERTINDSLDAHAKSLIFLRHLNQTENWRSVGTINYDVFCGKLPSTVVPIRRHTPLSSWQTMGIGSASSFGDGRYIAAIVCHESWGLPSIPFLELLKYIFPAGGKQPERNGAAERGGSGPGGGDA